MVIRLLSLNKCLDIFNIQHFVQYSIIFKYVLIFFRYKKQDIYVRLGEYDFNIKNETKFIDHRVTDIRLHPDYDVATHVNDIAIMKLKTPAVYSSIIRPICLPKKNIEVYNKNAVVAGKN